MCQIVPDFEKGAYSLHFPVNITAPLAYFTEVREMGSVRQKNLWCCVKQVEVKSWLVMDVFVLNCKYAC